MFDALIWRMRITITVFNALIINLILVCAFLYLKRIDNDEDYDFEADQQKRREEVRKTRK